MTFASNEILSTNNPVSACFIDVMELCEEETVVVSG
jgi:hypothetical protein